MVCVPSGTFAAHRRSTGFENKNQDADLSAQIFMQRLNICPASRALFCTKNERKIQVCGAPTAANPAAAIILARRKPRRTLRARRHRLGAAIPKIRSERTNAVQFARGQQLLLFFKSRRK
jgi:hypothetical protein